jgi:hypothetical protein
MSAGFGLSCEPQELVPLNTWLGFPGLLAQALGLPQEALIQRNELLERSSFHGAAPFHGVGAQPAFSSPIVAKGCAAMGER